MLSPVTQGSRSHDSVGNSPSLPEIPLALRVITAPVRAAGEWVWNVIVLRVKDDGPALALLFFGALGIFPFWIGLAMAVSGVVLFTLKLIEAKQEAEKYRSGYEQFLQMGQEVVRCKTRESDLQLQHDQLAMDHASLQTLYQDVIKRRDAWIAGQAQSSERQQILLEENNELKNQIQELMTQQQQREIERQCLQVEEPIKMDYEALAQALQFTCDQRNHLSLFCIYQNRCEELAQQALDSLSPENPGKVPLAGALYFFQQYMRELPLALEVKHATA